MQAILVVVLVMQQEAIEFGVAVLICAKDPAVVFVCLFCPSSFTHYCFCTISTANHTMKKGKWHLRIIMKVQQALKTARRVLETPGVCEPNFYSYWHRYHKSYLLLSPQFVPEMVMCINYFNPQICSYMKNLSHSRKCILFNLSTLIHLCCSVAGSWELIKV